MSNCQPGRAASIASSASIRIFIGRAALEAKRKQVARRIVTLSIDTDGASAFAFEGVYRDGKLVGHVTSAGYSYTLGHDIALALPATGAGVPRYPARSVDPRRAPARQGDRGLALRSGRRARAHVRQYIVNAPQADRIDVPMPRIIRGERTASV